MKRMFIITALVALQLCMAAVPALAAPADEARELVEKARNTLNSFMADKEYTWFHENLPRARGLLIFPRVIKAGFIWGGSGGNGVLVVKDEKTGEWSQPAFYSIGSISFGLQAGGESAEVVMMAMNQSAIDSLFAPSFKFGGQASVAGGPHGVGIKKIVTADFISFAKAKGLFAGLDFEGSGIRVREDLNRAYYGREVRPVQIIVEKAAENPHSQQLLEALRRAGK